MSEHGQDRTNESSNVESQDYEPMTDDQIIHLLGIGRYREAEQAARDLIAADVESVVGHVLLAESLRPQNRCAEALEASSHVLAKHPDLIVGYILRSEILLDMRRYKESARIAREAIRLEPENVMGHGVLATALYQASRLEEAKVAATHARSLDPRDTDLIHLLGLIAVLQSNVSGIVSAAKDGLAIDPDDPRFHSLYGIANAIDASSSSDEMAKREKHLRAERLFAEAMRRDPNNDFFWQHRKSNASDSRIDFVVVIIMLWIFCMMFAGLLVTSLTDEKGTPCCCTVLGALVVFLMVPISCGIWPEVAIVIPCLGKDYPIRLQLPPKERRRGLCLWGCFAIFTLSIIFLPMVFS